MRGMDVRVRAMLEESEIPASEADELVELLVGLEERYVDAVPEPSPELAVLLGVDDASRATRLLLTPRRRRALAAGLVALGAVATTGLAAAANELPEPAQRWVSELSDRYLPFHLPQPADRAAQGDESTRRPDGDAAEEKSRVEGETGRRRDDLGTTGGPDGAAQQYQPTDSDHQQAAETHDDGGAWEGNEDEPEGRRSGGRESEPEDAHVGSGQGEYETEDGEEDGEDTVPVKVSPDEPDSSEETEESDHEEAEEAEGSGDE